MIKLRFKMCDIFFYKYNDGTWLTGKITDVNLNDFTNSWFGFTILKTNSLVIPSNQFSYRSRMYNNSVLLTDEPDDSKLLALIL